MAALRNITPQGRMTGVGRTRISGIDPEQPVTILLKRPLKSGIAVVAPDD
jgi:hypothetical protein